MKATFLMAGILVSSTGRATDSAPFRLDTRSAAIVEESMDITYDASWIGDDAGATIVIRDNGVEVQRTTGAGEFTHTPTGTGRHELTYTTLIDGMAQEEVYRAVLYKGKYTVCFDANGGSGTMDNQPLWLDQPTTTISTNRFTRDGFFFLGWALSPGGEAVLLDGDSTDEIITAEAGETVTLYAVWREGAKQDVYAIIFNANGGNFAAAEIGGNWIGRKTDVSSWTASPNNVLTGLEGTFSGTRYNEPGRVWSNDSVLRLTDGIVNATGANYDNTYAIQSGTIAWVFSKTVNLTGLRINTHWEDGGRDGIVLSSVQVRKSSGSSWETIPDSSASFGAFDDDSGSDLELVYRNADDSVFVKNVTAIRFNLGNQDNNGTGFTEFEALGYASVNLPSNSLETFKLIYVGGEDVTLPDHDTSRIGYTLAGWSRTPDGPILYPATGTLPGGAAANDGETIDLYAVWTANEYDVEFDANGGNEILQSKCGLALKYYDISSSDYSTWSASEPALTNYFASRAPTIATNTLAFGESLDPGIAGVEQSSVNQFRSWGLNDLRFEVDGTTNRFHGKYAQKAQENISAFLTGFIAVSESGTYSFACIADDYEAIFVDGVRVCRSQWSTIGSGSAELARGAHSFSMGFHEGDGGHGFAVQWKKPGDTAWSPLPQSVLFEDYPILETATFDSAYGPLPETSRTGYTFEGWTLYGETVMAETICTQPSNHVLTAKWTPNDYTVSFDATGGAVNPASKGVTFDAAYGALPTPVREPYVFVDWRLDGAMVDDATIVTTPSNHVLSARWGVSIGGGVWEETICDEPISLGAPLVAPSGEVVVPSEIDGRPVVEIGADAFAGNPSITSITIPASVTNIADGAFAGCTGLKAVAIDSLRGDRFAAFLPDLAETVERVVFLDGVTAIPDDFFEGCTALRSMDIADSVVEIGTNVFEACSALTTTVLENGLEMYQGWVLGFAGGSLGALAPSDLAIPAEYEDETARPEGSPHHGTPYSVRGIAAGAFEGEFGIGTLAMPESLRFVGARAFKDCTALESISVPEGVAKIDREAFRNCTYAQGLALPGTLREIGDGAFANASMLMGATIPDGVVSVGECAFSNCWRMLSVAIPQSVERVGDGAFADCRRVAGVTVPLHVRPMSELFPAAYASLETISISRLDLEALEHLEGLESENAIQAYIASRQMVPEVFKGCNALEGIELPAWVRNVSDGALEGCASIASLEFPDAVTNIGARACAGMAALESVSLPASLVSIGDEAFDGDAGLAALHLPEGLRTIGERAFRGLVPLARAEIPGSVRTIGDGAFAGCAAIRAVSMPGDAGTVAAAFPDCYANIVSATVVAEEDGSLGELAPPKLMAGLFEGCAALTSVELPSELAEIGAEAFAGCTSLAEIGLPAAVTNLGERAFAGCGTLSSIALPKSLEELRDGTFAGCASIAEIVVPESVRRFGNGIFDGCTLLRSVRFVGNAPDYGTADGGPYAGVPAGAKSYVANGSKGWDGIATSMALPEYWPADTTYEIAFWTPNRCAVSFDANYEGAGEPAEVEQVTGTSYVLPPNPVRLGARFDGWWTAPENGARITASTQVTATRPHTFYAHWTMNRYYVHFDANGGSGTAEPVEMTVGTPTQLPPCPFAKVANDFAGWATVPGGEVVYADGAEVADLAYAQNAAVTLYAVWQARDWTLADYLDAPGLAFETAGGGAWGPDWNDAKAGGVSLRCDGLPPAAGGGTVEATLRATVVGAGTLSFWWKTSCEEMDEEYGDWFDYAAFSVDGAETAKIAGESGWRKVECAVEGAGEHVLVWTFVRDDYDEDGADWENALWVDGVEWTPAPVELTFASGGAAEGAPPAAVVKYEGYALALPGPGTLADPPRVFAGWSDGENLYAAGQTYVFGSADAVLTAVWTLQTWTLAEAVDAPALVFATGGDADWAVDAASGWTNGVSAKSGGVTNSQASWIETTVSGAGTLSFRWKVLGGIYRNTPFAYAKAEVDGTPASSTHLTDGWEAQALDIVGAGPHTIRWTYLRTSARDCDGDCAWLDGVEWTPTDATTFVVEGVSIPISWLDEAAATFVAANGGDYAAAARATAANGRDKVWECYVAGLDPTNAASRFLATIGFDENGVPDIGWTPDLGGARDYAVDGKPSLTNDWSIPDADSRFFRVRIAMPGGFGSYTISFDTDGGSTLAAITAAYGSPVTAPEPPTKDGYDFAGWSPPLPATMPARNLTAVAQWTPIDLFVDAESGDDANDGGQRATAKKTIQAAIDAAPDGGTIRVAPGVYGTIVNSGSKALRIESEAGPERTIIDGQGRRRCAKLSNQEAARDPCATLVGFTLRNGCRSDAGVGGAYLGRLESCVVSNCVAANEAAAAANCELLNCLVVGNVASNLNATTRGYICNNAVLRNCTVVGNRTVEGNGAPLFRGGVLRNCIVWDNDRFGTAAFSSETTVDHVATDAAGEGDIPLSSSPFSDAANGDYRLAAGSPCIDAGAGTFEPDATDLAGNPRVSGTAVDAGCYESQPVSPDSTGLSIRDSDIGE